MYCQKCGKELPDGANFCSSCGHQERVVEKETEDSGLIMSLLNHYDASWIVKITSRITLLVSLLIRILANEFTIAYSHLADEFLEFWVLPDAGKTWIIVVCGLAVLFSSIILLVSKLKNIGYYGKPLVSIIFSVAVSLIAAFLKIPVPSQFY